MVKRVARGEKEEEEEDERNQHRHQRQQWDGQDDGKPGNQASATPTTTMMMGMAFATMIARHFRRTETGAQNFTGWRASSFPGYESSP